MELNDFAFCGFSKIFSFNSIERFMFVWFCLTKWKLMIWSYLSRVRPHVRQMDFDLQIWKIFKLIDIIQISRKILGVTLLRCYHRQDLRSHKRSVKSNHFLHFTRMDTKYDEKGSEWAILGICIKMSFLLRVPIETY